MKNIELAYLTVAYLMAGIMMYSTRYSKFPTFSHVALGGKLARQTFFWGLLLAGILFGFLMYVWFIPHFSLGPSIKLLVLALIASQILTGFFPVEAHRFSKLHIVFASILAMAMFVLIVSLALNTTIRHGVRLTLGGIAAAMVLLAGSTLLPRESPEKLLAHEFFFFGLWHAAIFVATYLG